MKIVYNEICNQCCNYIYDDSDVYQKLFQLIYNASTSLYYGIVFSNGKTSKEIDCIKQILSKINEILSEILFPEEKEESIQNLLIENGMDSKELLVETPSLTVVDSEYIAKIE